MSGVKVKQQLYKVVRFFGTPGVNQRRESLSGAREQPPRAAANIPANTLKPKGMNGVTER